MYLVFPLSLSLSDGVGANKTNDSGAGMQKCSVVGSNPPLHRVMRPIIMRGAAEEDWSFDTLPLSNTPSLCSPLPSDTQSQYTMSIYSTIWLLLYSYIYMLNICTSIFSPSQSFDIFKDPSSQFNLHYASVDRLILLLFQAASTTSCHKSTCLHCLERAVQCRLDWDSSCVGFAGEPSHLSACYPAAALVLYEPIYSARSAL